MNKDEAVEFIIAAGNNIETAEYMVRNLPDSFDMDDDDIVPDMVYDVIMEGISGLSYLAHVMSNGK